MTDHSRRTPLLTHKGRVSDPCWAVDDIFVYNKEKARLPFRLQEWEFYQAYNGHFSFRVFYGHGPGWGCAEGVLTDFETGERTRSGRKRFFCGDAYDLDFTAGEPHTVKYEDETLFLSIGFDGQTRRILVRSDRLDAEFNCSDSGEAMVTAVPFSRRTSFLYQMKRVLPSFEGHVHMNKLDYPLGDDTVLVYSSGRGILPSHSVRIWAAAGTMTGMGYLALSLGEDNGPKGAPSENAVFLNGVMQKLGRVYFKFKEDDLKKRWRISDGSKRLRLEFEPEHDDYERWNYLAADIRRHRLFGRLSGTVRLDSGDETALSGVPCFIEHTDERR